MARLPDDKQPLALIAAFDFLEDQGLKEAFAFAVLELPRIPGIEIAPEQHGFMNSLGVYRGNKCCYAIKPAKKWLKVWIRKPELQRKLITALGLEALGFAVSQIGSGEYTLRIQNLDEMVTLVSKVIR